MDERALQIIRDYATANADKPLRGFDKALEDVAIVWKCKALQKLEVFTYNSKVKE